MLAAPCPDCGCPCPLSVSEPDRLSCAACGLSSRALPHVAAALRAAAVILEREAAEARQFGVRTRRLLASAGSRVLASVLFAWLMFFPPAAGLCLVP